MTLIDNYYFNRYNINYIIVVYFMSHFTDEGRPNMKHFIFIVKITVDIFVYDSGDVIN